jgi:hypothetical protein
MMTGVMIYGDLHWWPGRGRGGIDWQTMRLPLIPDPVADALEKENDGSKNLKTAHEYGSRFEGRGMNKFGTKSTGYDYSLLTF